MEHQAVTTVRVNYSTTAGWHVFQSPELAGLLIASEDPQKAFADVPKAIKALVELDTGVACEVEPELSFDDFLRFIKNGNGSGTPTQTTVSSRKYMVARARAA